MKAKATQKQQMNFFLSRGVVKYLQHYVPKGKQSQFVEMAIDGALSAYRFQDALKKSFGAWKNHPQDTDEFVRNLRHSKRLKT